MAPIPEIVRLDALALSSAIKSRRISCAEVMSAYLGHIERINPRVSAIVSMRGRDELMAEAKGRDAQIARGEYLGWMHGFPHAIKDLEQTSGIRTTLGSPLFKNFVPKSDTILVERIKRAGAIIIGKTNVPEFGLGSHTYNEVFGATLNAYDQSKTAGGSSGGAAVSLALRMLPVADGSDHAGSLRNPAAFNNVLGFRTSFGRVPSDVRDVFMPSLSVHGPMARTAPDLAMLLSVIAGYDARAPYSVREDAAKFAQPLERDFKGARIAWLGDFRGYLPFDPGVLELCRSALKAFESLGCAVEEAIPDFPIEQVWENWLKLRAWQVGAILGPLYRDVAKRPLIKPEARWEVECALKVSAMEIADASAVRTVWYHSVNAMFEKFDFLIAPAGQVFPFDAAIHWPTEVGGRRMDTYHRWMEVMIPITMSGCPALCVPAGFNADGLPMGIQIVAPNHREMDCLRLAHAYEQATDWVSRRPPPLLDLR
ncbi:MAG: amidase [Candidatus Binatus sp.]|uniref:amidase n=1 Tax=Candidatus Binatus sp. TaxID=2811406 RepID=UPI002715A99A|nr:amidase [Candidatus Binatus sp.]MDO8434165.1 amidase [Candidatus Binatus sp.]